MSAAETASGARYRGRDGSKVHIATSRVTSSRQKNRDPIMREVGMCFAVTPPTAGIRNNSDSGL